MQLYAQADRTSGACSVRILPDAITYLGMPRYVFFSLPMQPKQPEVAGPTIMECDGAAVSVQTRPLGVHSDGTPRWLLCEGISDSLRKGL